MGNLHTRRLWGAVPSGNVDERIRLQIAASFGGSDLVWQPGSPADMADRDDLCQSQKMSVL